MTIARWRGATPAGMQVFNVKDYGAVGNGVTDDATAIQAAINAAAVAGGIIYIPLGSYKTTVTLTVPAAPGGPAGPAHRPCGARARR